MLWGVSITLVLAGLAVLPTSILGALLIVFTGLYVSPYLRDKAPPSISQSFLMRGKGPVVIAFTLLILAFTSIGLDISKADADSAVKAYKSNPSVLADRVRGNIAAKEFFKAEYELEPLVSNLPNDESLKQLWHEFFIAKVAFYASKGELSLFSYGADIRKYKALMEKSPLLKEGQTVFAEQAVISTRFLLNQEKTFEASRGVEALNEFFPENEVANELLVDIRLVKEKLDAREAAKLEAERRRAAAQAKSSSSNVGKGLGQDPRNVYLYCISSTYICRKTPAECENEVRFHSSDKSCQPVACGTGAAIANTRLCPK